MCYTSSFSKKKSGKSFHILKGRITILLHRLMTLARGREKKTTRGMERKPTPTRMRLDFSVQYRLDENRPSWDSLCAEKGLFIICQSNCAVCQVICHAAKRLQRIMSAS